MKMAGLKIMEQFEISEEQSGFVEWGDFYGKNQMSELLSKGSAASHDCNDACVRSALSCDNLTSGISIRARFLSRVRKMAIRCILVKYKGNRHILRCRRIKALYFSMAKKFMSLTR